MKLSSTGERFDTCSDCPTPMKESLERLAMGPTSYPGVVQMAGEWAGYQRIRIGDLRVIFWYVEREEMLYVDHIGPRGDVYK